MKLTAEPSSFAQLEGSAMSSNLKNKTDFLKGQAGFFRSFRSAFFF